MFNIFKVNGKKNIKNLILIIILIEGIGFIAGNLGMSNEQKYSELIKPNFFPKPWVFPIVWVILYFLMAVSFYRILLKKDKGKNIKKASAYYVIQLLLNFIWPSIFFRFQLYGIAFLELLILLVFILLTIFEFYKIDKVAAFLLIPYVVWVFIAGILNYSIWILNK